MRKWQRAWLFLLVFYSFLHLIRDILQDLKIDTLLSTILIKKASNLLVSTILWNTLNTYIIALIEIFLAIYCLKRGKFGFWGYSTIAIALVTLIGWLVYWFYL